MRKCSTFRISSTVALSSFSFRQEIIALFSLSSKRDCEKKQKAPPPLLITPEEKGEVIIGRKFGGFPALRKAIRQTFRKKSFFSGFPGILGSSPLSSFRRKYCVVLIYFYRKIRWICGLLDCSIVGYKHCRGGEEKKGCCAVAYKRYTLRNFFRTFLKHSSLSLTSSREKKVL